MKTVSCSGLRSFTTAFETSVVLIGRENSSDLFPENTLPGSVAILMFDSW